MALFTFSDVLYNIQIKIDGERKRAGHDRWGERRNESIQNNDFVQFFDLLGDG